MATSKPGQPPGWRLADKMRAWRDASGLTQFDLQAASGVKREYISSIELGRITVIYPDVFAKLHKVLKFPAFEALEAMGYPTDVGEKGVDDSLLVLLRSLSKAQQSAVRDFIRATVKLDGALQSP